MPRPPDSRAVHALERVKDDPEFEVALRAAYRGRHDVLDALWWAAHPFTTSPRGVADPATGLRDLQRAVFSRAAANSPLVEAVHPETGVTVRVRESEHRLRQEQELLSNDAKHLADALSAVGATAAPSEAVAHEPPQVRAPELLPPMVEASTAVRQPSREPDAQIVSAPDVQPAAPVRAGPRPKILIPALAGMGVLSIILLLPTLTELDSGADGNPSPSGTTPARITTEIVTLGTTGNVTDPLAILERPQVEADRPSADFPTSIPLDNFRALPDMVGHVRLYLARNDPESVCLFVVQQDNLGMGACTPESDFVDSGINLNGGRYAVDNFMTILTETYSLLPSGAFQYDATARVRERDAPPGEGSTNVGEPTEIDPEVVP
jgi:hypothetical protein